MGGKDVVFRAGLSRFALGAVAIVFLPILHPSSRVFSWVYVLYILIAAVEQILIRKRIGGSARSIGAGMIDIAVLSFTVHRLGSAATAVTSVYVFAAVLNSLVVGPRVGMLLSCLGAGVYGAVVICEQAGLLPFAPDVPELASVRPSLGTAAMSVVTLTIVVVGASRVVALLVRALGEREAALVLANGRLELISQRDPLTGLFNRRHLFERLDAELARARRGHPMCVLLLDLDGFKRVNDSQGHLRGDVLLTDIAMALRSSVRETDIVGRYGGDEFVIVLTDADANRAATAGARVTEAVRKIGLGFDLERPVTASVGIALAEHDDDVASLLRRADENAYVAKRQGGDRVAAAE